MGECRVDGDLALDLLFRVVAHGLSGLDGLRLLDGSRAEEEMLEQACLARAAVAR